MADKAIISKSLLSQIGNAIRTMTGKTAKIPTANMASEILAIKTGSDVSQVTATAADVLSGVKFVNSSGVVVNGSISKKGAATYTPGTTNQTISAKQYLSGAQIIKGDANLVASNIKNGVSIFGKAGTLVPYKEYEASAVASSASGTLDFVVDGELTNLKAYMVECSRTSIEDSCYYKVFYVQNSFEEAMATVAYNGALHYVNEETYTSLTSLSNGKTKVSVTPARNMTSLYFASGYTYNAKFIGT